jgi:hypothetical protein
MFVYLDSGAGKQSVAAEGAHSRPKEWCVAVPSESAKSAVSTLKRSWSEVGKTAMKTRPYRDMSPPFADSVTCVLG